MIYVLSFVWLLLCPIPSPLQTTLWGFTCFTMTVCLWKSGNCTITPFHFDLKWWYTCVGHALRRTAIDLWGPKVQEKKRRSDSVLWQNPLYQQKIRKQKDNTQTPPKTSITQRLRTNLGRSVGVTSHPTGVVKPVYGYPTFPLTTKAN